MKKVLLSATALMAFGLVSQAQEIKFGAKAGVNFSKLGDDAEGDAMLKTGFHIGGVAEFKLTEQFSIQPELIYSAQGAKQEVEESYSGSDYTLESTTKLNYLALPIMAKYYIIEGLSIEAGPQIGLLLSAKKEYTYINMMSSGEIVSDEVDVKDESNSLDFGLAAGVAYDLPMGLFFNARYYTGLSNIYDGEEMGDDYKLNNSVFSLSLGYKF